MEGPFAATSNAASTFASLNPATGEKIADFGIATPSEVRGAVAVSKFAQEKWAREPIARRVQVVKRFAEILAERQYEIAALISAEAGKPRVEAVTSEILVVLDAARFCAEHVYEVLREETLEMGSPAMLGKSARIVYEPVGVVGIIAPWNYPFSIPAVDALAALVVGNGVVLKPSEFTPACGHKLLALLIEAGLPAGLLQVVDGFGETGSALIGAGVDKIVFTGSVATGRRVAMSCAERLVPCVLELGGKDAMLVLDDADVDVASSAAVWGSMMNAGQTCISVERCMVHRPIYDKFLDACVDKVRKLRVGSGFEPYVDVGPMISERQLEIVENQIREAIDHGAHAVCGGHRLPGIGTNFFAPTIMTDIPKSANLWCEETFGPVLAIAVFDSEAEAIAEANESKFGLSASVWTGDKARGEKIARQIKAGAVLVNDLLTSFGVSEAPHGGVKASGIGRTHGVFGMREMLRPKFVSVEKITGVKQLWWYNYTPEVLAQMSGFVDFLFHRGLISRIKGGLRSMGVLFRKRL
jgi:succinate-semialdehyde dehydrogenase/glutarate-semialdehyde dehydrogenase